MNEDRERREGKRGEQKGTLESPGSPWLVSMCLYMGVSVSRKRDKK